MPMKTIIKTSMAIALTTVFFAGFTAGSRAEPGNPSFAISNNSGRSIKEVYVRSARSGNWGAERLGRVTLPHGQVAQINLPSGECINDLKIVFQNGEPREQRAMNTCALSQVNVGGTSPAFALVNNSGKIIKELYISSAHNGSWGTDRLGDNMLANGQAIQVRIPSPECVNDIRVIYRDGSSSERRNINTCDVSYVVVP
jgi:hypothetical protein